MAINPRIPIQVQTALRDLNALKAQFPGQTNTEYLLMLILCEVRIISYKLVGDARDWTVDNT